MGLSSGRWCNWLNGLCVFQPVHKGINTPGLGKVIFQNLWWSFRKISRFMDNELWFSPAGTTSGLSPTDICRRWVCPPDMTAGSRRKHPGQSTAGSRKHVTRELYEGEGAIVGHAQSQAVVFVSARTFSASVVLNNTGPMCPHKALKTLNRDLQALVYSFKSRLMFQPSLDHRTLLPNANACFFLVWVKFMITRRSLPRHETAHNNIYGLFWESSSWFQETSCLWFLFDATRLASSISTDVGSGSAAVSSAARKSSNRTRNKYAFLIWG